MKSRLKVYVPLLLMNFVFVTALSGAAYANDEYDYLSDQLSREHRDGADVDEWIERGTATITASPRFEDGTRLTAWASKHEGDDSYEFAIASAVYFFEIPAQAQYIEILVRYRGEPSESYFEDAEPIAGRVWIRNLQREATRSYEDKSAEETRYGDTFVLRAKRRSETIKVAAAGHTDEEGLLEMHVVAEDGQQIDIEYINVSTYRKQHDIRVFPRYARHHHWRPWHRYTYSYFYDGPFYYGTDLGYYFRWTYPVYDRSYLSIRSAYGNYVHRYYTVHHRPYYYYRSYPSRTNIHVHVNNRQARSTQLNRWSGEHETARREYTRSRSSTTVRSNNRGNVRSRVNAIVQQHRQEQSTLTEQRQNSDVVRSRDRSSTNTRLNTTVHQRSRASSPYRRSFTQPNRSSQSPMQRRRYQPYSRSDGNGYNRTARTNRTPTSNAERRQRLSERSRSSYSRQYRAPSSNRQFGSRTSAERQHSANSSTSRSRSNANRSRSSVSRQRSSTSSRTSSSSRSRPPSTVRQRSSSSPSRSSSSSSSSSEDDDEKKSRSRQRQRSRSR
jgi:hypothetical protein